MVRWGTRAAFFSVVASLTACGGGAGETPLTADPYSVRALWRDLYDSVEAGNRGYDRPEYVIAANGVVAVSGSSGIDFAHPQGVLRAYDGESGSLLWSESLEASTCVAGFGEMDVVATTLIVSGIRCNEETVRAFDLRSGRQVWSREEEDPTQPAGPLLTSNGAAIASIDPDVQGLTIRMHDPADGSVVWASQTDLAFHPFAASSEKVVVAVGIPSIGNRARVRAYDSETGQELWNGHVGRASRFQSLHAISMGNGVLVTASWPGFYGSRLQARDELTGEELWTRSSSTAARSIVVGDARVYVVGNIQGKVRYKFSVNAYSQSSGELLWSDQRNRDKMDEHAEWAVLDSGRLIVGGAEMQIRVYDAATGEVLEEVFDDLGTGIGRGLAVDDGRIFSLAGVFEPDAVEFANQDFLLRAFQEEVR